MALTIGSTSTNPRMREETVPGGLKQCFWAEPGDMLFALGFQNFDHTVTDNDDFATMNAEIGQAAARSFEGAAQCDGGM